MARVRSLRGHEHADGRLRFPDGGLTVLRAGVIGLGTMGRHHVRVLSGLPEVQLIGVADPTGDPTGAAQGGRVFVSAEALIEAGLDMAVLAAPTEHHEQLALHLAEAGIATLVEKPLALTLDAAVRITEAFEAAGVVGAVGHIERFNPASQAMRARLESEVLGEVYQIATRRQGPFPVRIRDVGVILDLATHDVDLTAWVGGSTIAAISARTAHKTGRPHEDLVAATGVLSDGTVTNHLVNWLSPYKEREVVALGERGALVANTVTADLTFHANGSQVNEWEELTRFRGVSEGDIIRYAIPKPEPLVVEMSAFRDAVLRDESPGIVTMREGLEAVRVAEAMIRSAREGTTVQIASRGEERRSTVDGVRG
jgi:UDP-N-acetylglucosamine 3-dehydrogenase